MNLKKNNKKVIIFAILEGKEAYTEINFFEQFIHSIKNKYKNIFFISPFAIDGNIKKSKEFIDGFYDKLRSYIEDDTKEKFDSFNDIYVFCVWDKLKQKTNFKNNFKLLKEKYKNIEYKCLIFENGIEKNLFSKFFGKDLLSNYQLIKKLEYKKIKDIKSRTNKRLFWDIVDKAKVDTNSNVLLNIKERLLINGEKKFIKILKFIEKL